jgi:uncharacterized protein YgfB (UPF0149 family)
MPVPQLPDFEQALSLAGNRLDASDLAECHGVACALLCRRPGSRPDEFMDLLESLQIIRRPGEDLVARLCELFEASAEQLRDEQMRLALWIPPDEEPLEDRALALGRWCTGFLAGLGSGGELSADSLSGEVGEALGDLEQIARAEIGGGEETEEEEAALAEVEEYVRVVTLMMRDELGPPGPGDSLH